MRAPTVSRGNTFFAVFGKLSRTRHIASHLLLSPATMPHNTRRQFLLSSAAMIAATGAGQARAIRFDDDTSITNPCGELTDALRNHALTQEALVGLKHDDVWDCHAHLLGKGHGGTGAFVSPDMQSIWSLRQYIQYRFYLGAACVDADSRMLDQDFLARLLRLMRDFPSGHRAMLMAFDRVYGMDGKPKDETSAFHTPNRYAAQVANAHPERLRWTASIHPYRPDAVDEVARVVAEGAVAVKWLPPAMGIDPASPRCDAFYEAMAKHDLPLISHGGEERAVQGAHQPAFGNVLKLRRPLERGVRVVVAHCASLGEDADIDPKGGGRMTPTFNLFERLMSERAHTGRLFGDISATPQANRFGSLARILDHRDWDGRLLNGSDYPLPGVFPLFSVDALVERGWIAQAVGTHLKRVRDGNAMLFDFLLKRHLRIDGRQFPASTFETARVFRRTAETPAESLPAATTAVTTK
jgi:mannonate dehydratase